MCRGSWGTVIGVQKLFEGKELLSWIAGFIFGAFMFRIHLHLVTEIWLHYPRMSRHFQSNSENLLLLQRNSHRREQIPHVRCFPVQPLSPSRHWKFAALPTYQQAFQIIWRELTTSAGEPPPKRTKSLKASNSSAELLASCSVLSYSASKSISSLEIVCITRASAALPKRISIPRQKIDLQLPRIPNPVLPGDVQLPRQLTC